MSCWEAGDDVKAVKLVERLSDGWLYQVEWGQAGRGVRSVELDYGAAGRMPVPVRRGFFIHSRLLRGTLPNWPGAVRPVRDTSPPPR